MKTFYSSLWGIILLLVFISLGTNQCFAASPDTLKYIGHAFVKIKTSEKKVIYIDPSAENDFSDSADVVLISHEHGDHNDLTRVKQKKSCQVIRGSSSVIGSVYKKYTIGNIIVNTVPAYDNNYHSKNECVGFVIEFDGIKLYHAGDTGKIPEMANLASQNITYALLPMDGIYTMTPEEATQAAALIKAKKTIPIHTMPPPDSYDDAIVAKFTHASKLIVKQGSSIELALNPTAVETEISLPNNFGLEQNYPNPFNPTTVISYQLSTFSHVTLNVFDVLGREVATLVDEEKNAGNYSVQFNVDTPGSSRTSLPSGIYFYRLNAGNFSETKKMMFLK